MCIGDGEEGHPRHRPAAAGLVGQVVGGLTLNGDRVLDLVVSVSNTAENGAVLNLFDGQQIPFSHVEQILGPLNNDPEPEPEVPSDEGDDPETDDTGPVVGTTGSDDPAATSGDDNDDQSQTTQTPGGTAG